MSQPDNGKSLGVAFSKPTLEGLTVAGTLANATSAAVPATIDLGGTVLDKVGFYGTTPIVQRASSNQATTNIAVSASFGATQLAVVQEIMNTLAALGAWKGAA